MFQDMTWQQWALVAAGAWFVWWWMNQQGMVGGGVEGFWSGTPAGFFPRMHTLPSCLAQQNVEWMEKGVPVARHYNLEGQRAYFY